MASENADDETAERGDEWLRWPDESDDVELPDPSDEAPITVDLDDQLLAEGVAVDDAIDTTESPRSTMLPAVSGRIDNVASSLGALSMRIDSLISATTTYRSVMSDRLTEYADLVNRLNRSQVNDLEEFRKANERTVGEVRRTITDTEEQLRSVVGRVEQTATDVSGLTEYIRAASADSRELLDSNDRLGRFVTEALDQFAERVLGELRTTSERTGTELGTLRSELTVARESLDDLNEKASSRQVREAVDELRGDVSGLRRAVLEWPDLETVRDEVLALRADVTALLEGPVGSGDAAEIRFEAVLQELGSLREQLSGVFEPDAEEDDKFASFVEDLQVVRAAVEALPGRDEVTTRLGEFEERLQAVLLELADEGDDPLAPIRLGLEQVRAAVVELAERSDDDDPFAPVRLELEQVRSRLDLLASTPAAPVELDTTALETHLTEVAASITGLWDEFAALAGDGDEPGADPSQLVARRGDVDRIRAEVALVGEVRREVSALREDLSMLRAGIEARAGEPDPAVSDEVEALVGAVRDDMFLLRSSVESAAERAASGPDTSELEAMIGALRDEAHKVSMDVSVLRESLAAPDTSGFEEIVEGLRNDLAGLRDTLSTPGLGADTAGVEEVVAGLRDDLVSLSETLTTPVPGADLAGVEGVVGALRDDLATLRETLAGAQADGAAAADTTEVEALIGSLRDDMWVLKEAFTVPQISAPIAGADTSGIEQLVGGLRDDFVALRESLESGSAAGSLDVDTSALEALIGGLREDVWVIRESLAMAPAAASGGLEGVIADLASLRDDLSGVSELRDEVTALRRRMKVRAKGDAPQLSDDQVQAIVSQVVEALRNNLS